MAHDCHIIDKLKGLVALKLYTGQGWVNNEELSLDSMTSHDVLQRGASIDTVAKSAIAWTTQYKLWLINQSITVWQINQSITVWPINQTITLWLKVSQLLCG